MHVRVNTLVVATLLAAALFAGPACAASDDDSDSLDVGLVRVLTESNFAAATKTGRWLVKFYAPWCGHCKKMAPMYEEVAGVLHADNDVTVAKVDCTSAGDVCSSLNIKGYPTVMYLEDGGDIKIRYTGTRDLQSILDFVRTAARDPIVQLQSTAELEDTLSKTPVAFVLVVPEGQSDVASVTKVAKNLIMVANFYAISAAATPSVLPEGQTAPALFVHKDGETTWYQGTSLAEASVQEIESWCRGNRWQKYFELTRDGVAALQEEQPELFSVIAVLNPKSDNEKIHAEMRELAEKKQPEGWQYRFVWLDGEKMRTIVRRLWSYDTNSLPKLVVQHTKTMRYWVPTDDSSFPNTEQTWAFLGQVHDGVIAARGGKGFMGMLSDFFTNVLTSIDSVNTEYPMLAKAAIACVMLCAFVWLRNAVDSARARVALRRQTAAATKAAPGTDPAARPAAKSLHVKKDE